MTNKNKLDNKSLKPFSDEGVILQVLFITLDIAPEILESNNRNKQVLLLIRDVRVLLRSALSNRLAAPVAIARATALLIEIMPLFSHSDQQELKEVIGRARVYLSEYKQEKEKALQTAI